MSELKGKQRTLALATLAGQIINGSLPRLDALTYAGERIDTVGKLAQFAVNVADLVLTAAEKASS